MEDRIKILNEIRHQLTMAGINNIEERMNRIDANFPDNHNLVFFLRSIKLARKIEYGNFSSNTPNSEGREKLRQVVENFGINAL